MLVDRVNLAIEMLSRIALCATTRKQLFAVIARLAHSIFARCSTPSSQPTKLDDFIA